MVPRLFTPPFFQRTLLWRGVDVDSAGNAVVAGMAASASNLPGAPDYTMPAGVGAFQQQYAGGIADVYVAKFTPDGRLVGSTYLGGSLFDWAQAIALAPNGSVVVVGQTSSPDFSRNGATDHSATKRQPVFRYQHLSFVDHAKCASLVATSVAPGEIVALRGYGIGPATGVSATGPVYPDQLAGVQVSLGGFAAPLFYAQSGQVNVQVPWELAGQTSTTVQLSYPGVASIGTPIEVTPALPGIFFVNNSDGTRNSPSNPAKSGDYIAIYGTGGGTTNAPGVTGQNWGLAPLSKLALATFVVVDGQNASVLYAGSAPTLESGIFQINAITSVWSDVGTAALFVSIGIPPALRYPSRLQLNNHCRAGARKHAYATALGPTAMTRDRFVLAAATTRERRAAI